MADISKEIQDFRDAIYGEEVRGSLISLAEKVNKEATDASQAAANSSASAGAAASNAQLAVTRADTAAQNANRAAQDIQDKADAGNFTGTVRIGTVTTGKPGSEASVSNSGTAKDAVLDIAIPRGNQGISFRMRNVWEPETDYVNDVSYIDIVSYNGSTYGCLTSHRSSELVTPANTEYWQCLARKGDTGSIDTIDDVKIGFVKAEKRANINPDDTLSIILGKVEKIYADLKDVAFSGKYSDLTGALQNVSELENDVGYVTENTWKANTADSEGYVASGKGQEDMVWGTDSDGNPGWKKLGTAAAAGIANNLATTQEGFLLDARQGKELADQLSLVNSAMEIVSGAQHSLTIIPIQLTTVEEINNYHDNYSSNFPNYTYYRYMASNTIGGGNLGNATWYIEGCKLNNLYEWQMARTYLPLTNGGFQYRVKWNGAWGAWEKIQ